MLTRTLVVPLTLAAAIFASSTARADEPNTLSKADQARGWKLLFDGKTTTGWRGYKKDNFPDKGWKVEDGAIRCMDKGGGGDIITADQFADFEFECEWKVAPKANSGIIYRVAEKHDTTWQTGPEYQVYDDQGAGVPPDSMNSSGACYDLYAPPADKPVKPAGEWNQTRIVIRDGLLQHWLNGRKLVEARMDLPEWKEKIAASKFKGYEGFGMQPKGHIALQDHGNDVWYRNLRIRDLSTPVAGEVALFNGKDMTGWSAVLPDGAKLADVWSVKDGAIICKGTPAGYIKTDKAYRNFILKLEWRFNPAKAGNSGVLLRMQAPDKVWPKSVEAQLQHENAGDFWNIDEFKMTTDAKRLNGRNTKKTHMAERPLGEWNEYEIIVNKGDVILRVNGEELNRAWDVEELSGPIGLQSEGSEIHFRNIRIVDLDAK